jgi:hypothetical protein
MTVAQVHALFTSRFGVARVAAVIQPRARSIVDELMADERLGRAFVKGTIVGTVLVFVFCGGLSLLAGLGVGAAIGVGAFTAFWGGPGFGGMMGATGTSAGRSKTSERHRESDQRSADGEHTARASGTGLRPEVGC